MTEKKLYNPEGMYDLLFDRCFMKKQIEQTLRTIFSANGFLEIETPMLEFYNVFYGCANTIPEESLFKLMDEKGRIMALRPEMTIPSARVAVTKLKDKKWPLKISYIGKCFKYDDFGGGKQREFTQAGVEILGNSDVFTDAMVIATAVESLKGARLQHFTIELGQVEFFKGLMEQAGLQNEVAEEVRDIIEKKDFFGLEEWLKTQSMNQDVKDHLGSLPEYFGSKDMLLKVRTKNLNPRSAKAIDYLLALWDILEEFNIAEYVAVDLGMVSKLSYYTGFIFKGMTYGVGFPILTGGRYDTLCREMGMNMPATGFSIDMDMALTAYERIDSASWEKPGVDSLIWFSENGRKTAIRLWDILKKQQITIDLYSSDEEIENVKQYAMERNIGGIIRVLDQNNLCFYDMKTGTQTNKTVEEITGGTPL